VFRRRGYSPGMASTKDKQAAQDSIAKAQAAANRERTLARLSSPERSALGRPGVAVTERKRLGADSPKTRAELYELAKQRGLPGRSRMGRDELAKALNQN
jgi:hypothetical protein